MKNIKTLSIFALILVLMASCVFAAKDKKDEKKEEPVKIEKTVESIGEAVIVNGDTALAKDAAITDAQIKALEEVCGAFIDAETIGSDFDEVEQKICKNTKGYISSYKVINEETIDIEDSKIMRVKIKAEINVNQVYDSLKDIQGVYEKLGKPKFFIIADTNDGKNRDQL